MVSPLRPMTSPTASFGMRMVSETTPASVGPIKSGSSQLAFGAAAATAAAGSSPRSSFAPTSRSGPGLMVDFGASRSDSGAPPGPPPSGIAFAPPPGVGPAGFGAGPAAPTMPARLEFAWSACCAASRGFDTPVDGVACGAAAGAAEAASAAAAGGASPKRLLRFFFGGSSLAGAAVDASSSVLIVRLAVQRHGQRPVPPKAQLDP